MPEVFKKENLLLNDQIEKLQKQTNKINLSLTSEEVLKSRCTHRKIGGVEDSLVFDPKTGVARCSICGRTFKPLDPDNIESVNETIDSVISYIESLKLLNSTRKLDETYGEMYKVVPMLEKLPELIKLSAKNFNTIDITERYNGVFNMFNSLNQVLSQITDQPDSKFGTFTDPNTGLTGFGNIDALKKATGQEEE